MRYRRSQRGQCDAEGLQCGLIHRKYSVRRAQSRSYYPLAVALLRCVTLRQIANVAQAGDGRQMNCRDGAPRACNDTHGLDLVYAQRWGCIFNLARSR